MNPALTPQSGAPSGHPGQGRPPVLLAFDTSTEQMAIALLFGGQCLAINEAGGAAASAGLLPAVHSLLARAGLSLQAVDAVAFGQGPGAFTGLRTACAVAQGLALGLGCGLLPIDSLLIVAEDARCQDAAAAAPGWVVDVAMDARMQEAYAARYRHDAQGWHTLLPPALMDLPALAARVASTQAPGPAPARAGSAWRVHGLQLPPLPAPAWPEADRAAALGRLARAAWAVGAAVDPAAALPLYLRDKVAQTTEERLAAKLQAAPR